MSVCVSLFIDFCYKVLILNDFNRFRLNLNEIKRKKRLTEILLIGIVTDVFSKIRSILIIVFIIEEKLPLTKPFTEIITITNIMKELLSFPGESINK